MQNSFATTPVESTLRELSAKSEARRRLYETALSNCADLIFVFDLNCRFTFANAPLLRVWNKTAEEAIGKSCLELGYEPWQAERHEREVRQVIATRQPFHGVVPFTTPEGKRIFDYIFAPVLDAAGNVEAVAGSSRDITERHNAEQALVESRERLQAALHGARSGTFRWDIRTNALDWDEALDALFGLPPGNTARSLSQFIALVHPDDRADLVRRCNRCAEYGSDFNTEFRVVWPDGSIHWLHDQGKTFSDDQGRPLYMTGACVEITARKHAEAQTQHQRDLLELIVRGASLQDILEELTEHLEENAEHSLISTVLLVDSQGRLVPIAGQKAPPEWSASLHGVKIGPSVGSCGTAAFRHQRVIVEDIATDPLWEDYREAALKHNLRACWSTPIISSTDTVLGTLAVYYQQPATPTPRELQLADTSASIASIAIERKLYESALTEARAKLEEHAQTLERRVAERTASLREAVSQMEEFSYTVSHDLRAPLRAMQTYSQALVEDFTDTLPSEALRYAERIVVNAQRLDKMIVDVLTFSRLARSEVALAPIDLDAFVRDLIQHYPGFQTSGASITIDTLGSVIGHEPSLTQVISNLIGNAVKFVASGVTPTVRIHSESRGANTRLWIEDNGIGVPPNYRHRLFSMFERIHPDLPYEGSGVGLAIVRKAMERMNGTFGVDSDGTNGSQFWIELPSAPPE